MLWERSSVKLVGGPHGMPAEFVVDVQRQRLLDAMAKVVAEVGYQDTTVRKLLARARLSRKTYYELYDDKEECFLAAYDEAVEHVLALVVDAYGEGYSPEDRIRRALEALLRFCADEPQVARMCIVEVLAAGPKARERRAATMDRLAKLVEGALRELRGDDRLGELSARALIGGVHEIIYEPVDRGDVQGLPALADQIVATQLAPLASV